MAVVLVGRTGNWNYIFAMYVNVLSALPCPDLSLDSPSAYLIYTGSSFCRIKLPGRQEDYEFLSTLKFKGVLRYTYTHSVRLNGVMLIKHRDDFPFFRNISFQE